jgi:nitrate reductase gamma subunit
LGYQAAVGYFYFVADWRTVGAGTSDLSSDAAHQVSGIGIVFKRHLFLVRALFFGFPFSGLIRVWRVQ